MVRKKNVDCEAIGEKLHDVSKKKLHIDCEAIKNFISRDIANDCTVSKLHLT